MYVPAVVLIFLSWFVTSGVAVDSLTVSLEGTPGNANYLEVGTGLMYQLKCRYRAGYDDKVQRVSWFLYGREVYGYNALTNSSSATVPLIGNVNLSHSNNGAPQDMQITKAVMDMAGVYTCVVQSTKGTVESEPILIKVINIAPGPFQTNVSILSNLIGNRTTTTNPLLTTNKPFNSTEYGPPSPPKPHPSCVLVWRLKTPAISPKPEVKCGYYSYVQDSISDVVSGGLQIHQLPNNSWVAEIRDTKIPVMEIPYEARLGCIVTIPNTNYRKLIKFEDGLSVDYLIDTHGCPSLEGLTDYYDVKQVVSGATPSCRGDMVPSSKVVPARAAVSCPTTTRFRDGRMTRNWRMELSCSFSDMKWREISVTENGAHMNQNRRTMDADETVTDGPEMDMRRMNDGLNMEDDMVDHGVMPKSIGELVDIEKYPWPLCISDAIIQSGSSIPRSCSLLPIFIVVAISILR